MCSFPLAACQKQSQFNITASPSEVIKKLILLRKHNHPEGQLLYSSWVKAQSQRSSTTFTKNNPIVLLAIPSPPSGNVEPITALQSLGTKPPQLLWSIKKQGSWRPSRTLGQVKFLVRQEQGWRLNRQGAFPSSKLQNIPALLLTTCHGRGTHPLLICQHQSVISRGASASPDTGPAGAYCVISLTYLTRKASPSSDSLPISMKGARCLPEWMYLWRRHPHRVRKALPSLYSGPQRLTGWTQLKVRLLLKLQTCGHLNTPSLGELYSFRKWTATLPTYFLSKLALRANSEILKNSAGTEGIWNWNCNSRPTPTLRPVSYGRTLPS